MDRHAEQERWEAEPERLAAEPERLAAEQQRLDNLYRLASEQYPELGYWEHHCVARVLKELPALSGLVLDLGAATGGIAVWLLRANPALTIVALDPSRVALERGRAERPEDVAGRLTFQPGLGEALPFPGGLFDAVYSSHTMEHIAEHGPVLAEVRRVLKPGCPFFVLVPEEHNYDTGTHCHHWSLEQFAAHWAALGVTAHCRRECERQLFAQIGWE